MRVVYKWFTACFLVCGVAFSVQAQQTNVPAAEFDVIVKVNGDIITARVMEVGLRTVRYQRTDIPNGPIYELARTEVYAISYRNQLKEYFTVADSTNFAQTKPTVDVSTDSVRKRTWYSNIAQGEIRLGVGLMRNYSKIENAEKLTEESGSPAFHLAYLFPYRENIHIGVITSFGTFKYSEAYFSEYDQLQVNRDLSEKVFSLAVVGRYSRHLNIITPYVLGGLAFYSSTINTNGSLTYVNDDRIVRVQNSARNSSIGFVFRLGLNVNVTKKIGAYADFGNGLTLGQVGAIVKL